MPRIEYVPEEISEPEQIVSEVRKRRGGTLLNLDRMLLHSPQYANGWNNFIGQVRSGLLLDPLLRELAICAVGVLNDAPYEVHQHTAPFLQAGGREAQLRALQCIDDEEKLRCEFSETERAVIQLTKEMTRQVYVEDMTFESARLRLGSYQELVELVGVIAAYNMVSRFLVALQVDVEGEA